jgi:hypothetical protein
VVDKRTASLLLAACLQRTAGNGRNKPTGHRYAARFSVERPSPPDRAVAKMGGTDPMQKIVVATARLDL